MKKTIKKTMEDNKEKINAYMSKMLENNSDEAGQSNEESKNIGDQESVPETLMDAVGALPALSIIGMDSEKRLIIRNRNLADT